MRSSPQLGTNSHGYFEVRFKEQGVNKRQSLKTKDESEAQRAFAHFLLRTRPAASYTIGQAWVLRQEAMDSIVDKDRIHNCWKALLPFFGPRDVESLQPKDVAAYTAARVALGRQPSTVRRELVELKATLAHLVSLKKMKAEQLPVFELPPTGAARPFFLTEADCARVFAAAAERRTQPDVPTRLELFLHIGLGSGQRRRAIERLAWSQVDFTAGMIYFALEGERLTKKRKASLPMSSALQAVLAEEYARRTSDWVLRMPGSVRNSFDALFSKLGLGHCTPHTLRHTLISHLLMRGKPIFTVSQLIAVSVAQIERTYGHLTTAHMRAALETT